MNSPIVEAGRLLFREDEDVLQYAEREDKIFLIWEDQVFDVTEFQT